MEKIKKILLVRRSELDKKWWHRLSNVIIFGTTIIVFVVTIFVTTDDTPITKYEYTGYSFESSYSMVKGREQDCTFYDYTYASPTIYCGDLSNSTDFLSKWDVSPEGQVLKLKTQQFIEKYNVKPMVTSDNDRMNYLIKNGRFHDVKVKRITHFLISSFLQDISLGILITLGWFIFWESIVYRSFVYVVLGKRKTL